MLISSAAFPQDIKGAYFRGSTFLPTPSTPYCTSSLTLITDASQNIFRPSLKAKYGTGAGYTTLSLVNTSTVSSSHVSVYSYSFNVVGSTPAPVFYQDTFWVAGIKNFSASDKSRLGFFADIVFPDFVDIAPEVTNLPLSISNFTVSGNQVLYNPYCQDADGDSLSYELVKGSCYPGSGVTFGGSYLPNGATIDPVSGLFSFSKDSTDAGRYAFTIYIGDWRKINGTMGQLGTSHLSFVLTTNLTLGLTSPTSSLNSFALFPNPTIDVLKFAQSSLNEDEKVKIEISNTLGEIVVRNDHFDLSQNLDVSSLSEGTYIVKIKGTSGYGYRKFIKVAP